MSNCRKCNVELVAGENWHYGKVKRHSNICKQCVSEYNKQYRLTRREELNTRSLQRYYDNHEEKKAQARQYRADHLEQCKTNSNRWQKEHPGYAAKASRQWHKDNPERTKEYRQKYNEEHREENSAYSRRYYQEHLEECRAKGRQRGQNDKEYFDRYRQDNREMINERARQWCKANPDKIVAKGMRRRALKRGATIGEVDVAAVYELCDSTCIYCGDKARLTIDHVIPLNGGGHHVQDNLVVACLSCNSSKCDRKLEDWLQMQPRALVWVV